jgi:hypothetical protein
MMGYYRLSSFDEVAKAYSEIKPIRGARADQDLRPLTERRYWWNRVHKVSDNKYILLDGYWAWSSGLGTDNDNRMREQTAPIVWERKEDGDYMTVRNHMNGGTAVSRYDFLKSFLPQGMFFHYPQGGGKHFVSHNGVEHYLPKFKGDMDWQSKVFTMMQDNKLVFKAEGDGGFTRVNNLQPMQTRRVDKDLDSIYKPKMKEMWDWMQVVLPVMGESLGDAKDQYSKNLTEGRAGYWYWERYVDKNLIREILDNPEHDKRMALAGLVAYQADAITGGRFAPNKDSYAKFRDCLRKTGGMFAVELR